MDPLNENPNMIGPMTLAATAVWLLLSVSFGQAPASRPTPTGVWRGTSVCLVRPSPCHDEIVVYRITGARGSDSVSFDARKIVKGKEEEMGILMCRVTEMGAEIRCTIPSGIWRFTVRGDSLVGDLRLHDNTKFRDVRTARSR